MYEWDEAKRKATIEKHQIDFTDMVGLFSSPHLILDARSEVEQRHILVGKLGGSYFSVVYTTRGANRRIITARKARRDEREQYQAVHSGRDPENEK